MDLKKEAECPICKEYLTDPVTLDCGHNVCRGCITRYCEEREDLGDLECPLCKARIRKGNLQINRQLANIVDKIRLLPVENLCVRHHEKLNLFCREDKELVCVVCERSPEHEAHHVLLLETAALEFKEEIKVQLQSLEKEREKLMEQEQMGEESSRKELDQVQSEMQAVSSAFQGISSFLGGKESLLKKQLLELEEEIEKGRCRRSDEISRLGDLVAEMTEKWQQPTNEFLQHP